MRDVCSLEYEFPGKGLSHTASASVFRYEHSPSPFCSHNTDIQSPNVWPNVTLSLYSWHAKWALKIPQEVRLNQKWN